jgi:hypothetical protein
LKAATLPLTLASWAGIDFISFGEKNVLCVMDFQPLLQDEDYLKKYIDPLIPMRNRYEVMPGRSPPDLLRACATRSSPRY